jgi:hypothetical protein
MSIVFLCVILAWVNDFIMRKVITVDEILPYNEDTRKKLITKPVRKN